jgi:hypothetical protein
VAKQHGFLLDRDDPVLVTVSLNRQVLAHIVGQIGEAAVAAKREIAAGAARQADAAKAEASHLIAAAAEYADEQFRLAAASIANAKIVRRVAPTRLALGGKHRAVLVGAEDRTRLTRRQG